MLTKRGQVGMEYLILVGFLVFISLSVLALSLVYSANLKDQVKINQLNGFFDKVISSSEIIFYSGEPSKTIINAYLPDSVKSIEIIEKEIKVVIETNTGENIRVFSSNVNLAGNISSISGLKRIHLTATDNNVIITE